MKRLSPNSFYDVQFLQKPIGVLWHQYLLQLAILLVESTNSRNPSYFHQPLHQVSVPAIAFQQLFHQINSFIPNIWEIAFSIFAQPISSRSPPYGLWSYTRSPPKLLSPISASLHDTARIQSFSFTKSLLKYYRGTSPSFSYEGFGTTLCSTRWPLLV